jgi:hypothetical protein
VCGQPIEVIDITRNLKFTRGNAVKYTLRADLKGNTLEDLKKAVWYLQDEIDRLEAEETKQTPPSPDGTVYVSSGGFITNSGDNVMRQASRW